MSEANELLAKVASTFGELPQVAAVALGGSMASGTPDEHSDADLYVYTHEPIPADTRREVLREFAIDCSNADYWGPSTVGRTREGGLDVDMVFFDTGWLAAHLTSVLLQHQASLGYTTAFVHTVHRSKSLSDPSGWFESMQAMTRRDYPEQLSVNIIRLNWPVLAAAPHSYREQLRIAVGRSDQVSINHRLAAFLASYFDVLFALNRIFHPGEKRLVGSAETLCAILPANFRRDVTTVVSPRRDVLSCVDALVDELAVVLAASGHPVSTPA